jgi:hypothetical protein
MTDDDATKNAKTRRLEKLRDYAIKASERAMLFHAVEERLKETDYRGEAWDLARKKWLVISARSMRIATELAYEWFLEIGGEPVDIDKERDD